MNQHVTTAGIVDAVVRAVLEGGPADIPPRRRAVEVTASVAKIKVEHLGGYEHFERHASPDGVSDGPVVFRWTMRTRIAE